MASRKSGETPVWPPKEEFADRLSRLRRARPCSNQQIADAVGLQNSNTVSNWQGGQKPEGIVLLKLAEFFDVSPVWLLTGEELATPPLEAGDMPVPKSELLASPAAKARRVLSPRPPVRKTPRKKRGEG